MMLTLPEQAVAQDMVERGHGLVLMLFQVHQQLQLRQKE
jgi:hypothetical protein